MTTETKFNLHARRRARRLLLQALYQWHVAGHSIKELNAQYAEDENMPTADVAYFQEVLQAIPAQCVSLDAQLQAVLDRPLVELDAIELTLLRIGVYELATQPAIPYRVVINEAVTLAKKFGGADGHKYINGVLDKLAKKLRVSEM